MNKNIKVLVFTKYDKKGASSRLRSIQYFESIEQSEISIVYSPLFNDEYLNQLYSNKKVNKLNIFLRYLLRFIKLLTCKKYDVIWIEKELFPWIPFNIEGFLSIIGIKYIVDYDDAIFHNYDLHKSKLVRFLLSGKITNVMKSASLVTVGNDYLKKKALISGAKKIETIPTVVNLVNYYPSYTTNNKKLIIGWIGTPKTEKYVIELMEMFKKLAKLIDFKLILIGGKDFNTSEFEYEIIKWSEESEVESLKNVDIGIMPLSDTSWEKGKCGYKLIQYMACGKPVIATNIGMNYQLVNKGRNGFLVSNTDEWISAFLVLSESKIREKMGRNSRKDVENKYSLQATYKLRIKFIKDVYALS